MIFNFLKYSRPIWYFNLLPKVDWGYFPTPEQLAFCRIDFPSDTNYVSKESQNRDQAYMAFQSGFINRNYQKGCCIWKKAKLPIEDEYRFLRKNVHSAWVFYVLMVRLITFNNPLKELSAFIQTRNVARMDYSKHPFLYPDYATFESPLLNSRPLVSIIIPTLNRYAYLKDVLRDLELQD